jgi:hypothetical protein
MCQPRSGRRKANSFLATDGMRMHTDECGISNGNDVGVMESGQLTIESGILRRVAGRGGDLTTDCPDFAHVCRNWSGLKPVDGRIDWGLDHICDKDLRLLRRPFPLVLVITLNDIESPRIDE